MKRTILFTAIIAAFLFSGYTFAQPASPSGLTASLEEWHGIPFVNLTWQKSDQDRVQYNVYKGITNDRGESKFWKMRFPVYSPKFKDYLVGRGFTYNYFVVAKNRDGKSEPSDTVSITIPKIIKSVVVTGTVTDESDATPIRKAWVHFIPKGGAFPQIALTKGDGTYKAKLTPGDYSIYFSAWGYLPEFYQDKNFFKDADVLTFNENDSLDYSAGLTKFNSSLVHTISGTVKDSTGNPIKAVVKAISLRGRIFTKISKPSHTDSLGNYSVKVIEGDSIALYVRSRIKEFRSEFYNDKRSFLEADKIGVDGDITGIDFILSPKPIYNNGVAGSVKSDSGDVLEAAVTLFRLKDNHRKPKYRRTVVSDSLGNFEFTNLHPGNYLAFALAKGKYIPTFYRADGESTRRWRKADTIVVSETGKVSGIDFTLHQVPDSGFGRVHGIVKDQNGDAINGAVVYAIDENGITYSFAATDESGKYTIENLIPGKYQIISDKMNYDQNSVVEADVDYNTNVEATANVQLTEQTVTDVTEPGFTPEKFELAQNYPNPFNPSTIITYQIPSDGIVQLNVFNLLGQKVAELVNSPQKAGVYNVKFNAENLSSGVYFYTLKSGGMSLTKKMLLLR